MPVFLVIAIAFGAAGVWFLKQVANGTDAAGHAVVASATAGQSWASMFGVATAIALFLAATAIAIAAGTAGTQPLTSDREPRWSVTPLLLTALAVGAMAAVTLLR